MKTIWKYKLEIAGTQVVSMPVGAQILSVQLQHGTPFLWAMVNPDNKERSRIIRTFGTGEPISEEDEIYSQYVGTYQGNAGFLIFHVFVNPEN